MSDPNVRAKALKEALTEEERTTRYEVIIDAHLDGTDPFEGRPNMPANRAPFDPHYFYNRALRVLNRDALEETDVRGYYRAVVTGEQLIDMGVQSVDYELIGPVSDSTDLPVPPPDTAG